jgi:spermidine synthase
VSGSERTSLAAVALALTSAICAASHELVWGRLLGRAVGNTAVGVGLTLTLFMLGSGAGSWLAARLVERGRASVRSYAVAELAIALGALVTLAHCLRDRPWSASLGVQGSPALVLDVVASSLVTLVPAIGMGLTYPLLVALTPPSPRRTTSLYAAGLVGAVLGFLGLAIVVAPRVGLDALGVAASVGNAGVGALSLVLLRGRSAPAASPAPAASALPATMRFAAAGALGLGAQVIWNRCLVPYAGVALLTFAAIVASYVLGQALGFLAHARSAPPERTARARLALTMAGPLVLLLLAAPPAVPELVPLRDDDATRWVLGVLAATALGVLVPATLLGFAQADALDEVAGDGAVGRVVGAGTILSALGSALTSFVLLPWLGPRWALVVLALPVALVLAREHAHRFHAAAALGLGVALAVMAPGPAWFLGTELDRAPVLYAEHGVQDSTAVVRIDTPLEPEVRRLVANGVSYSGDSVFAQRYMRLLAHLPSALSPHDRALLVCVGTGTTLDALRTWGFSRIDAVDISPSIRQTLPYFRAVNHDVARERSIRWIVEDGARHLRTTDARYDVITLEPPPPRAAGASALYSVEFYEAARARLTDEGTLAQWLPLHGMSSTEVASILAAFVEVFPHARLHLAERNEAILLGRTQPFGEPGSMPAAARADLSRIGLARGEPLEETRLATERTLRRVARGVAPIRDAMPVPEHAPLGDTSARAHPMDQLLDALAQRSEAPDGSWAALVAPTLGAFYRVREGEPREGDREAVAAAMRAWLARDPSDPYAQHVFGYGPLLTERLDRLEHTPPEEIARRRAEIEARTPAAHR